MSAKAFKKAVATMGKYTNAQGEEKKRYTNVGTLFQQDDGRLSLKLDAVPVGEGWSGWISFYDLEPKKDARQDEGGEVPF